MATLNGAGSWEPAVATWSWVPPPTSSTLPWSRLGGGGPAGVLVYAATPSNVRHVWIEGEPIVEDGQIRGWSIEETITECRTALARVRQRVNL